MSVLYPETTLVNGMGIFVLCALLRHGSFGSIHIHFSLNLSLGEREANILIVEIINSTPGMQLSILFLVPKPDLFHTLSHSSEIEVQIFKKCLAELL